MNWETQEQDPRASQLILLQLDEAHMHRGIQGRSLTALQNLLPPSSSDTHQATSSHCCDQTPPRPLTTKPSPTGSSMSISSFLFTTQTTHVLGLDSRW